MGIFSGLPANSEPSTIKAAVLAVVQRTHAQRQQSRKYSLGELPTDEQDFDWLHDWACQLDSVTARTFLRPDLADDVAAEHRKRRVAIGSLLFLWAAESARRTMPVESEWLLPAAAIFPQATRALLFTKGVPTPAYLAALREAGFGLGLRECRAGDDASFLADPGPSLKFPHLFNNFLMVQVGLTDADIGKRLSVLMTNDDRPLPLSTLLDEQRGSQSFQKAWYTMQAYRQLEVGEEWLRQTLGESTWILPPWVNRILSALKPKAVSQLIASIPLLYMPPPLPVADQPEAQPESGLDIFGAFLPFGGVKTVMKALRAITVRIEQLELGKRPWSLAELRLSDYDFLWLRVWVRQLEPFTVQYCQERKTSLRAGTQKVTFQAGLGLLLLLWLSETARRISIEGELWPHVVTGHFKSEVGEQLFTQGQSSHTLRELLRAAIHRFNLRHVLAEQGGQRWMDTVFLQFGFTARGSRQRLPEWLTGQATTRANAALLGKQHNSVSFQQLWEDLRAFRQNQISEQQLLDTLTKSPWALPEWIEDLISLAKAPTGWEVRETAAEIAPDTFLSSPVLHWPHWGAPQFLCQILSDLSHLKLTESGYDVVISGAVRGQLLRQEGGNYLPVPSHVIALEFDTPMIAASLVNENGETVLEQDVELWPANDDVVAYRFPSGERLPDAFEDLLTSNVSYGLLIASDLKITPQPTEWTHSASGSAILHRLLKGWPNETQVWLEGDLLWTPKFRAEATTPVWANQLGIFLVGNPSVKWGKPFLAKILHHPEVSVRYVRCQVQAIEVEKVDSTNTQIGPLSINSDLDARCLEFRIGLENGSQRCTVRRKLDLNTIGAVHLSDGTWQVLNKHSLLTVEQAKHDLFRISLPTKWGSGLLNANEMALMEGDGITYRRPTASGSLGTLHGWGATLKIRHSFNFTWDSLRLTLAGSVVNHGILSGAIYESLQDGRAPLLRLCFRHPIEPDENYSVIWWGTDGNLLQLKTRYWDEAEGVFWWVCELPEEGMRPLAVAVAYKGERQGSWWEGEDWLHPLARLVEQSPRRTAALLRWFHLPLLSWNALPALRTLAESNAVGFLRAWLLNEGLPDQLAFAPKSERDESWLSVVRTIFFPWKPDADQARDVLMALGEVETDKGLHEYLPDAVRHLNRLDPLIMARVLRGWQDSRKKQLVQNLRLQLADCHNMALLPNAQQNLLNQAEKNLKLDLGLINTGILRRSVEAFNGEEINITAQNNLALAARIEELRRLLALRLLEHV